MILPVAFQVSFSHMRSPACPPYFASLLSLLNTAWVIRRVVRAYLGPDSEGESDPQWAVLGGLLGWEHGGRVVMGIFGGVGAGFFGSLVPTLGRLHQEAGVVTASRGVFAGGLAFGAGEHLDGAAEARLYGFVPTRAVVEDNQGTVHDGSSVGCGAELNGFALQGFHGDRVDKGFGERCEFNAPRIGFRVGDAPACVHDEGALVGFRLEGRNGVILELIV